MITLSIILSLAAVIVSGISVLHARARVRRHVAIFKKACGVGEVSPTTRQYLRRAGYRVRYHVFQGDWVATGPGYIGEGCIDAQEGWWRCLQNAYETARLLDSSDHYTLMELTGDLSHDHTQD